MDHSGFLAIEDNAESHYACSSLRRHRRTGLSDMLQRCSRALLSGCSCMSPSTTCPAGICQSHDQLQAKGNCSCQEWLCEFSLTDDSSVVQLPFFFPLGFLYFILPAFQQQVMHIYILQAYPSNVVPLQRFYFFIPNAFQITAKGTPQFFFRAINTLFNSHYASTGQTLLLLYSFRITLYNLYPGYYLRTGNSLGQ